MMRRKEKLREGIEMVNIYILATIITVLNLGTFVIYAVDKIKAVNHAWRIAEHILLKVSMLGPFGAYLGMKVFRHKVKKPRFYVGVPFFAVIQLIIILIAFWLMGNH